jgi:fucose permease
MGTFAGAILLVKFSGRKLFIISMIVAIPALLAMLFMQLVWEILALIFAVGFSVANVFSIIFSAALKLKPESANEISGLLVMGIAGGAFIPWIMGVTSDSFGQVGGLVLLLAGLGFLLFTSIKIKEEQIQEEKIN